MIDINKVFNKLKQAEVISHYWHLNTTSYATHKALGSFYDDITDLIDDLVEEGTKGVPTPISIPPAILLNIGDDHIAYFEELDSYLDTQLKLAKDNLSHQDLLLPIKHLVEKTLYRFRLS